jgi:predicted CoA-binding protein
MLVQGASLELIEDFLAQKRIVIVGMPREAKSMSEAVFKELSKRGYDVVPVNPNVQEVLGRKCFARVQDPAVRRRRFVDGTVTEAVVKGCAECGIKRVWMHRGVGEGSVSAKAIEACREHGIRVIPGECPPRTSAAENAKQQQNQG